MRSEQGTVSRSDLVAVIFGEPDIDIIDGGPDAKPDQIRIKIKGVDVFHPNTGEVRSDEAEASPAGL